MRALSRQPDEWRHSARDGQSTGPKSGQSRLTHGGAESAEESELSRRLLAPPAPQTGASQSYDRHRPSTRQTSLSPVTGENPLSGTRRRGVSAQRSCASAPATPHASPAPRMRVGASNTPLPHKQGEETRAKETNSPAVYKRIPSNIGPLCQMFCAISRESRQRDRRATGGVVPVCSRGSECSWLCHW